MVTSGIVDAIKHAGLVVTFAFALCGCRGCAKAAANCHGTEDCDVRGACGGDLLTGGGCIVVSAADCRASAKCKSDGKCGFDPAFSQKCAALRVHDCQASTGCRKSGRCSPSSDYGRCEVTDLGCKQTDECASSNKCRYERLSTRQHPLDYEVCSLATTSQADWCKQACDNVGACTHVGTKCIADDPAKCLASGMCTINGSCSLDIESQSCVPASDDDCKSTKGCTDYGECRRVAGGDYCVGASRDQ